MSKKPILKTHISKNNIIECVECEQCRKLHRVGTTSFISFNGDITLGTGEIINKGDSELSLAPLHLCRNNTCLVNYFVNNGEENELEDIDFEDDIEPEARDWKENETEIQSIYNELGISKDMQAKLHVLSSKIIHALSHKEIDDENWENVADNILFDLETLPRKVPPKKKSFKRTRKFPKL